METGRGGFKRGAPLLGPNPLCFVVDYCSSLKNTVTAKAVDIKAGVRYDSSCSMVRLRWHDEG